jgi:hypothetical protein
MSFLQIEDDISVEPDGILEHPENGFTLPHTLAAGFSDDDVIAVFLFVQDRGQCLDPLETDGLWSTRRFVHNFAFLQRYTFNSLFAKLPHIRPNDNQWHNFASKYGNLWQYLCTNIRRNDND